LRVTPSDLRLAGIVSEHGYENRSHWLLFLFEIKFRLKQLPPPHREGRFGFFPRNKLGELKLPKTDLENIWSWFWEHRDGFFAAHCHCNADGTNHWTLEESVSRRSSFRNT
jgi:hypothetical protein